MSRAASLRALAGLVLVVALAGCTQAAQSPGAADPTASPAASGSPVAEPAAPVLDPSSAEASKAYFDSVVSALLAERPDAGGRELVDALAAAGFDKAAMQVTYDDTPTGNAADNVQFSVLLAGQCLVGQKGAGGYTSVVVAPLGTGGCLIGQTRPIDW